MVQKMGGREGGKMCRGDVISKKSNRKSCNEEFLVEGGMDGRGCGRIREEIEEVSKRPG